MVLLRRYWPGAVRPAPDTTRRILEQFCYRPLPTPQHGNDHSFRLLHLLPGTETDPVCCEIQTYPIENAPRYEALSYCWGPITNKAEIQCDNYVLEITANVFDALRQLRQSERPRLLWIDQICIDQQNLLERSYQVSIMRPIYYKAARTIVWLGPSDKTTKMAFDSVNRLAKTRAELEASGVAYSRIPDGSELMKRYELPSRVEKDEKLYAMTRLLKQPWFQRVWIIQEIAHSQSALVVQGNYEVPWQDFAAAMLLTWELRMTTFTSEQIQRNIKNVYFIECMREQIQKGQAAPLRYALNLFRESKATDPRDKVYALVGCSLAFRDATPAMLSYERSVGDAYRIWTIHALQTEKSLEILSAVKRYRTSSDAVPYSWIPDWNATDDDKLGHVAAWPSQRFQATAASEIDISFRDQETVLGLLGHMLDRIESVGTVCSMSVTMKIFGFTFLARYYIFDQMWRSWEALAQVRQRPTYTPTGENMWDAYWQTLLFGENGADEDEKKRLRTEFDEFYAAFRKPYLFGERCRLYWSRHLWAIYYVVTLVLTILGVRGKYKKGSGLAFTSRMNQTGGRRLVRTQAGYIGLAVHGAEVGDYVALFKGARMPFVVRSNTDHWQLIGDSYVHGVMNGESWHADRCEPFWIH